jgi:predicted Zn-dependent protease
VIDRHTLAHAIEREGVSDYVVIDRDQQLAIVDEAARTKRVERRTRWQLVVHVDTPKGRGSAHLAVDAVEGTPERIVQQAVALAKATIGPAWVATPPAAPARVALLDDKLAKLAPLDAAADVLAGARPDGATVSARATYLRETVTAIARGGFHTTWDAGLARVEALVAIGDHSIALERAARTKGGLALQDALADAAAHAEVLAKAGSPPAGPVALVLSRDALVPLWDVFAHQADAVVEREGLTRYREHSPVAHGAEAIAEPLTIASDGALAYGVLSAPLGDEGDAVRRFSIVERGIAAGLGLSPREAALRGRDPNGGVRNLIIESGTWDGEAPPGAVHVRRLRDLAIDRYTGEARLEIGLASQNSAWFAGGTIRLDLIDVLAHARRSARAMHRAAYVGPESILVERAKLET